MKDINNKIVFIYAYPHHLHKAWANIVTKKHYKFIPKIFPNYLMRNPIISQVLALFKTLVIPKADIYLAEDLVCILPAIIKKRKKSKIIVINSSPSFLRAHKSKGLMKLIFNWYISKVDGIISTSELMGDISIKSTKVPNKIVYPPMLKKELVKFDADLRSGNIGHGLSGLCKNKGTDIMINAFLKLKNKKNLFLIGPIVEKMDEYEANKKREDIILTGWTNNPGEYLKKCSFFVNCARLEPFGLNILEAMSVGIPPIVSNMCGSYKIVEKISKKLVIKPSINEIINRIEWLQKNPDLHKRLGKKSKYIAEQFIENNKIENFKKEFNKLLYDV